MSAIAAPPVKAQPGMGDFYGGLAAAVIGLAQLLTLGVLGYGALGPEYIPFSVQAAFNAAVFGGLAAALVGGTAIPATGPRAATTLIFATYVAALVARPEFHAADGALALQPVLMLAGLCIVLSGVFQVLFGCVRLGSLVRFVPYPVIAGFMNGIAVLLVIAQIPYLLGCDARTFAKLGFRIEDVALGAGAVALFTAGVIWLFARRFKQLPIGLMALALGACVHQLIGLAWPGSVGAVLGTPQANDMTAVLHLWPQMEWMKLLREHGVALAASALLIAVVGTLDSLLAAAAADISQDTRHQPNRTLIGEGVGNIVAGVLGGIPVQYSAARSLAAFQAGGRTRLAGFVTPLALLALLLLGGPLFALIPLAALAGVMLTVSTGLVDRWSSGLVRHLVRVHSADATGTLWVVLLVCLTTVVFGFIPAVGLGMLLAMVLFIRAMNHSLVRAVWTGTQRFSRRIYAPRHEQRLRQLGERIRIFELEGPLFFGTAEKLSDYVEEHSGGLEFLILDLRRVPEVDATGALVLQRLNKQLRERGCKLLLAHVAPKGQVGQSLDVFGTFKGEEREQWYADTDRALEAAELTLLGRDVKTNLVRPVTLRDCSLLAGLSAEEVAFVVAHLEHRRLKAGEILFNEGDPGDRLYLLTAGMISLMSGGGRAAQRLVTFEPGVMFGEMAMLDGHSRSATAVADQDTELYAFTRKNLSRTVAENPKLSCRLMENLAVHLTQRLRMTTDAMRAVSDAGD